MRGKSGATCFCPYFHLHLTLISYNISPLFTPHSTFASTLFGPDLARIQPSYTPYLPLIWPLLTADLSRYGLSECQIKRKKW